MLSDVSKIKVLAAGVRKV